MRRIRLDALCAGASRPRRQRSSRPSPAAVRGGQQALARHRHAGWAPARRARRIRRCSGRGCGRRAAGCARRCRSAARRCRPAPSPASAGPAPLARRSSACTRAAVRASAGFAERVVGAHLQRQHAVDLLVALWSAGISGTRSPSPRSWRQACSPLWPGSAASITTTSGRCRCMRRSRSVADSMVVTVRPWASK